jgi:hypothetical protein
MCNRVSCMSDEKICAFSMCNGTVYCRGYCNGHYRQWLKLSKRKRVLPVATDLEPLRELTSRDGGCDVCGGMVKAVGLCNRHYTQMHVHGRLTPELERG